MPLANQAESAKAVTELNAWKNNAGVNQVLKQYKYPYFVWNCKKALWKYQYFFLNWCYSSPGFVQTGNAEILCVTAREKVKKSSFVPKWNTFVAVWADPRGCHSLAAGSDPPVSSLPWLCQPWAPNATRFFLPTPSYSHQLRALLRAPLPAVNVIFSPAFLH